MHIDDENIVRLLRLSAASGYTIELINVATLRGLSEVSANEYRIITLVQSGDRYYIEVSEQSYSRNNATHLYF